MIRYDEFHIVLPGGTASGLSFLVGEKQMNKIKLRRWIEKLIADDELWRFYKSKEFIKFKTDILKENHYECYECKKRGIITRYDTDKDGNKRILSTVHHVRHVREYPELALSRTFIDDEGKMQLQLIPVCKACHNKLHPEKQKKAYTKNEERFENEERW